MPEPDHANPVKTTRITIKGSSGYCPMDAAFHDRVSLTPHSIEYTYKPDYECGTNRPRKWFYKTDSPMFSALYHQVEVLLPRYLDSDEIAMYKDLDITEFIVTYGDKSRRSESWCCPSEWFSELFAVIKKMVPPCEEMPQVLVTYDNDDE